MHLQSLFFSAPFLKIHPDLFCFVLQTNVRLHRVNLAWNGFDNESAEALAETITENTTLKELDLTGNRLSDQAIVLLAEGLERNDGLHRLIVSLHTAELHRRFTSFMLR